MKTRIIPIMVAVLLTLAIASIAVANGTPTIDWKVIAGGGGHAEAGIYALDGTIGQPVVGLNNNASYQLCAGFWCRAIAQYLTNLPLIMR
jgi:hypothetical protein